MIFQNSIVRFIAFFIPVKDMREHFIKSYSRQTKYAKLREDNKRLFNENKLIKQEINNLKARDLNEIKKQLYKINSSLFSISNTYTDHPWVYLSIACMAYNEGPYLKEWIEYHRLVGVQRFYFYDNGSDDDTFDILEPYIRDGIVTYYKACGYSNSSDGMQTAIYNDAVCKYRYQTYWLAIIDLDEFLLPVEKDNMAEALKDYEDYPAVALNWVCFDTNGHKTKPTEHGGLVTANYTRVSKEYDVKVNRQFKSIVNPRRVIYANIHSSIYDKGYCVTENLEPLITVRGPFTKHHSSSKIRINHYFTKSEEEYLKRHNMQKQNRNRNRVEGIRTAWLVDQDFEETTEDMVIQKYVPRLKMAMGIKD